MRRDLDLLQDIERTAAELGGLVEGVDEEGFVGNDLLRSAAMYKLVVIGEAAGKLSPEFRSRFADVPWPAIISFRNRATHAYFAVDWSIAFHIVSQDVVSLRSGVQEMLDSLESGEE